MLTTEVARVEASTFRMGRCSSRAAGLACFDNDGRLWYERPSSVQFDFFVDALKAKVRDDPRPDPVGLATVGLPGSEIGLSAQDPTLAELLKPLGCHSASWMATTAGSVQTTFLWRRVLSRWR